MPSNSLDRSPDNLVETVKVEAVVRAIVEEFEFVHLETLDGDTLGIGELTRDIDWRNLRLGQRVLCEVEVGPLPRVLSAHLIEPGPTQEE